MDHFVEQLIKKQTTSSDTIKRAGIILGAVVFSGFFVLAALVTYALYLVLLIIGVVYLAVFLIQGTSVEYEYILTNGELDIDKIIGKRKRKRLVTIKMDKTQYFGPYSEAELKNIGVTVLADDATGRNVYCLISNHSEYGTLALVFNPNDTLKEGITATLPRSLKQR